MPPWRRVLSIQYLNLFRVFLHGHVPALLPDVIPQNVYGFPSRTPVR